MPFYDWECDCGYQTSSYEPMTGGRVKDCPKCGKMNLHRLIGMGGGINVSTGLADLSGERIWFPKDGKPYFDKGLQRTFNTPLEKKEFMDKHKIISDGSLNIDDKKKRAVSRELVEIDKKKIKEKEKSENDMRQLPSGKKS